MLHGGEDMCQWPLRGCGADQEPGNHKVADGGSGLDEREGAQEQISFSPAKYKCWCGEGEVKAEVLLC